MGTHQALGCQETKPFLVEEHRFDSKTSQTPTYVLGSGLMNTPKKLGIFVSSDKHLNKIIKLCEAAAEKEVEVMIFFTHRGTLLTQDSCFSELEGKAKMSLCRVSFESHGLKSPIKGIDDRDLDTQARNVEMIEECDRYLVF